MKTPAQRLGCFLCLLLLLVGSFRLVAAQAPVIPDYQIGDSATDTVKTPVRIRFVDPDATEAERDAKAREVYPFFRYVAGVSNSVESAFRNAYNQSRSGFLAVCEKALGKAAFGRGDLDDETLAKVHSAFQQSNNGFPVTMNLARLWASGDDGLAQQNRWAEKLRQATSRVIRPSGTWSGSSVTAKEVRLLSVAAFNETVSLYDAERKCRMFRRSTMVPLNRARQELEDTFAPTEREVAKFLSALVEPNCDFDHELTRQSAFPMTNDLWAYSQLDAGETVIEAGQKIDARTKAALDEVRRSSALTIASSRVAEARSEVATGRNDAAGAAEAAARMNAEVERVRAEGAAKQQQIIRWAGIAFCLLGVAAMGLWWKVIKRRPRMSMVRRSGEATLVRREPSQPVATTSMPYSMRRMLHERGSLVACQEQAESEIQRFEQRLLELHTPLNERLKAYEGRIADLERQLASRTEENRELLRAAIDTTRRKLEVERQTRSVSAN
jgi:cell division protein ZapA (FtsZ GTPase activity inhibitor)